MRRAPVALEARSIEGGGWPSHYGAGAHAGESRKSLRTDRDDRTVVGILAQALRIVRRTGRGPIEGG